MKYRAMTGLLCVLFLSLSGCGKPPTETTYEPPTTAAVTAIPEGKPLSIPSDPNAKYYVIDKAKKNGNAVIITQRIGSSGVSYSSRLYDCANGAVKYLGTGETRAAMEASVPDPSMGPITPGSIADYVGQEACQ